MKGNQIDDLFRKKLSHQKLAPPPAAWGAIEQNLPAKKKKGAYFWLSIAASLLVVCTAGWLLINSSSSDQAPVTAQNEKPVPQAEEIKTPQTENTAETLVAETKEEAPELKKEIETPAITQQQAASKKINKQASVAINPVEPIAINEMVVEAEVLRTPVNIDPLQLPNELSFTTAIDIKHDMLMPLDLSAYYILKTDDIELAPRKRKFRVLNGIISIAKEVNNGKLSFSELRNAKNNFVEDDLKYGSNTGEGASGEDDDKPDEPGKD